MIKKFILALIVSITATSINVFSYDVTIGRIKYNRVDVFDTSAYQFEFFEKIANSLHALTREYVIEDELLFKSGDELNDDKIYETERNLRNMGLFSKVSIKVDSVSYFVSDVTITTHDKWSTKPNLLLGFGGKAETYGARIEDINLFGHGNHIMAEGLYRTENDIKWQGQFFFEDKRIFRTDVGLSASLFSNKFKTVQNAYVYLPFRNFDSKYAFGVNGRNMFGSEFIYSRDKNAAIDYTLEGVKEKTISAWFARAWRNFDRVFFSGLIELHDVERESIKYQRAYDNTGRVLLAFSSSSEDYLPVTKVDGYLVQDLPVGGWGSAVLGRIFPIGHKGGKPQFYVGAQVEKSFFSEDENVYLFGQMSASGCFSESRPSNTYQEFLGLGFYRLNRNLLLAGRIRQQAVWNWGNNYRQLLLDNENGLRGYRLNELSGDNRLYSSMELRWMPNIRFWFINLGMTSFWDFGTVWNRTVDISRTQWHHSVGMGLRIYNDKSGSNSGAFRIDFAYNFDKNKLAEIIFTTDQFFSAIGYHGFEAPKIYGIENDTD
jgi:outer membrane protein assembly factor BamA